MPPAQDPNTLYVKANDSGQYGTINLQDYNPAKYTPVPPSEALAAKGNGAAAAPAPQHDDLLNNPVTRGIQDVFPGKQMGQSIGTLGGYGLAAAQDFYNHLNGHHTTLAKNYDLSAPTPLQTAGDAVSALATPLLGAAEGPAANAALAGAAALGSHVSTGDTSVAHALEAGAGGAAAGGALSALGGVLAPALAKLPTRIAQKALSGATPETAQQALQTVKYGPIASLLAESKAATQSGAAQIDAALSHPDHLAKAVTIEDFMPKFADALPNSGLAEPQLQAIISRLVPTEKTMVQKLFAEGGLPLKEANRLRSVIDNVVKPVYINGAKTDAPAVAANKQIGAAFAGALRESVKTAAPETRPLFESLQKEIQLRNALAVSSKKFDKRVPVGLYDILSGIGGFAASGGNPLVTAGAIGLEKLARNPGVQLGVAKAASKAIPAATKGVGAAVRATKGPIINAASR